MSERVILRKNHMHGWSVRERWNFYAGIPRPFGDECWEWRGQTRPNGYGVLSVAGQKVYAHRLSWVFWRGAIPRGLVICHRCDNPLCVNPDHLFLGTMKDNSQDSVAKGRAATPPRRLGPDNNMTKLAHDDYRRILERWKTGGITKTALAHEFGVHRSRIYQIVNGIDIPREVTA